MSYGLTGNAVLLRFSFLIACSVLLHTLIMSYKFTSSSLNMITGVYFLNLTLIYLSYAFPTIALYLSNREGDSNRFGGIVGYDFVAFLTCSYVAVMRFNRVHTQFKSIFHLAIIFIPIVYSGRFGLILYFITFTYIYISFDFKTKIILMVLLGLFIFLFPITERLIYSLETFKGFFRYIISGGINSDGITSLSSFNVIGFYYASPLTWANEFITPILNISNHILPVSEEMNFDSGPAYSLANIGLILTLYVYLRFIQLVPLKNSLGFLLIILLLITDLKMRCLFSIFPMVWFYILIKFSIETSKINKL
jgi:hypothetical protein